MSCDRALSVSRLAPPWPEEFVLLAEGINRDHSASGPEGAIELEADCHCAGLRPLALDNEVADELGGRFFSFDGRSDSVPSNPVPLVLGRGVGGFHVSRLPDELAYV